MYFIAVTLCLCNHCLLPCNATEIYCWLLRGTISHSFVAINHPRNCFLWYDIARYACCHHPHNQQHTKCFVVTSLHLAMVSLLSSHTPWHYDCFLQHQKYCVFASLAMQHLGYAHCCRFLCSTAYKNLIVVWWAVPTLATVPCVLPMLVLLYCCSSPTDMMKKM